VHACINVASFYNYSIGLVPTVWYFFFFFISLKLLCMYHPVLI